MFESYQNNKTEKYKNKLSKRKMKVYIDIEMCAIVFIRALHKSHRHCNFLVCFESVLILTM
jgi:hypothetical protein